MQESQDWLSETAGTGIQSSPPTTMLSASTPAGERDRQLHYQWWRWPKPSDKQDLMAVRHQSVTPPDPAGKKEASHMQARP